MLSCALHTFHAICKFVNTEPHDSLEVAVEFICCRELLLTRTNAARNNHNK